MTIELEHAPGTSMTDIKIAEMEHKKNSLAQAFGWSREEFDDKLDEVKEFFELNKKETLGK